MPRRKNQQTIGGVSHVKLARTLVRTRAERALSDPDDLQRQAEALVDQLVHAHSGKKQSDAGKASPGRRGKYRVQPEVLLADVQAMHKRSPNLTFADVCETVARRRGYGSAWSVKKAAAGIKWTRGR